MNLIRTSEMELKQVRVGHLDVHIFDTADEAANAAAAEAADILRKLSRPGKEIGVIFAAGASQLKMLQALTAFCDLRWERVCGFHMGEYVGIDGNHPASFRRFLREHLVLRVPVGRFFPIDGCASDLDTVRTNYIRHLNEVSPQLGLLGIGENGQLAFNDPATANFEDAEAMKLATLDSACRNQQVVEGWFASIEDVPQQALTLTIPTLLKVPRLVISALGPHKANSVRCALTEAVSTNCPASILRTHPNAALYLDHESASELSELS
jgi:glucosamine-6-phosphate deaminase